MTIERINFFVGDIRQNFGDKIKETQKRLNRSKNKKSDFNILADFWNDITLSIIDTSFLLTKGNYYELFSDCKSKLPMPESVEKQVLIQLFDIKNLNPLTDLEVDEGIF